MKREFTRGSKGEVIVVLSAENEKDERELKKLIKQNEIDTRHSFGDKPTISIKIEQLFEECKELNPGNHVCFNIAEEFDSTFIPILQELLNDSEHLIKEYSFKMISKNKVEVFCDSVDHQFH